MYARILVPVDGSAASIKGLGAAVTLAKSAGAKIKLLHVVDEFVLDMNFVSSAVYEEMISALRKRGRQVLEKVESIAKQQGVAVESELVEKIGGRAADSIVDAAKQWSADLVVMGTHGRRGLRRLALGSDAETVLRLSPVPVLMVRDTPEK